MPLMTESRPMCGPTVLWHRTADDYWFAGTRNRLEDGSYVYMMNMDGEDVSFDPATVDQWTPEQDWDLSPGSTMIEPPEAG